MSKKFLCLLKKSVVMLLILMLFSTSVVSAASFRNTSYNKNIIQELIERFREIKDNKIEEYSIEDLNIDLENMKKSGNIDMNKIKDLISKLPTGENKSILEYITKIFDKTGDNNLSSLLDMLLNAIKSLIGKIGGSSSSSGLPVEPISINMDAKTAVEFSGDDYKAKLHANVYMHVDENGNTDSDNWVVLIHPFMLKGQTIAKKIGPYYYEKGYNILAPDLRGFGDSEGSVALGFLESLDVYDWINKLNDEYNPNKIIIHGVSLGGATTNFLTGIDEFINNGPTKINTTIKSLRELNVIGLVEDCGYTDMTEFEDKDGLLKRGIGLTEENFDYYSKATNSLKYCDLPMLIIHGTKDTTVKPENADIVRDTVRGETEQWLVDGASHAFIIMGSNSDQYKEHVQKFIDKYQESEQTTNKVEEKTTMFMGIMIRPFNFLKNKLN